MKTESGKRLQREQILILAVSAALAAAYLFLGKGPALLDGNTLPRNAYGGEDGEYRLEVAGLPEGKRQIKVRVRAREYTEAEARAVFDDIAADAAGQILGDNPSLREVSRDLRLPSVFPDYPGVRLAWYPADPALISARGEVFSGEVEVPADTFLRLQMKTASFRDEIILPVTIIPASEEVQTGLAKLMEVIDKADEEQINEPMFTLPESVDGIRVLYNTEADMTWLRILLAGTAGAAAAGLIPAQEKRKAARIRESSLLLDYADLVSRLNVYLGAGLPIRNAWFKITKEYKEAREAGRIGEKTVYEEMTRTAQELEKGVSERRAYVDFAHRCGPRCYLRLSSILEQNLRAGDKRLGNALELEMQEALEQRKNMARRLGEEAGTKLVLPLIMSLAAVMMIVTVPAMLTMM